MNIIETQNLTKSYADFTGDNYIVLRGDNFSGNLELTVEDVQN